MAGLSTHHTGMQSEREAVAVRPLILTLALDEENQARFEGERRRYFPARLNRIPAHVSLFHALPGEELEAVRERLGEETSRVSVFPLQVHDLMRLGRGVAYRLRAPALFDLHARLRAAWLPWLSRQDLQPFQPHVVVQNKVDPGEARALYDRLSGGFRPWTAEAASLQLWFYEGGPWTLAGEFPFPASALHA